MIRVYLVDDHAVVREGVKRIIAGHPGMTIAGEAATAAEARRALPTTPCDVVVLDLGLPDRGGLELLGDIRRAHPTVRILILSVLPEEAYAVRALRAGAHGYLMKDSAPTELVTSIETVARGKRYVTDAVVARLAHGLVTHVDPAAPLHERLSAREHDVLVALGQGLGVSEVADKLGLGVQTVSTYRRRVLEKLGLQSTPQLIHYALKHRLTE